MSLRFKLQVSTAYGCHPDYSSQKLVSAGFQPAERNTQARRLWHNGKITGKRASRVSIDIRKSTIDNSKLQVRVMIRDLASLYGVETRFYDGLGRERIASDHTLLAVLRSLGAELSSLEDAEKAIFRRRLSLVTRPIEPVNVAWDEEPFSIPFRIRNKAGAEISCRISDECSGSRTLRFKVEDLPLITSYEVAGEQWQQRLIQIPEGEPGYYSLSVQAANFTAESHLIRAPTRAYSESDRDGWGYFVPMYALRSRGNWGVGDWTDWVRLSQWMKERGAGFAATLPLLATFLSEPLEPSPYLAVSRFFWNELYLDPKGLPEWETCEAAREHCRSDIFQLRLSRMRQAALIDYRSVMAAKREVLELMSRHFYFDGPPPGFKDFLDRAGCPLLYAAFRASLDDDREVEGSDRLSERIKGIEDLSPAARYHLYVQWSNDQQIGGYQTGSLPGLYLDLPLGLHPGGYDIWRHPELFVSGHSGGAPPDDFFTEGQAWGFPPLHPISSREEGHAYFRESMRFLMGSCRMLRIDHVMSLFRLYWVPQGMEASQGTYVQYPAPELLAILSLESHRAKCTLVGEDLGTVPDFIREGMQRHGLHRMFVGQFEAGLDRQPPTGAPEAGVLACLNTHDMHPFAAFLQGSDVMLRQELGLISEDETRRELQRRADLVSRFREWFEIHESDEKFDILKHYLLFLACSEAAFVLINLEDLWLETRPQNVPGTGPERPNWRLRCSVTLEDFCNDPEVLDTLEEVNQKRGEQNAEKNKES